MFNLCLPSILYFIFNLIFMIWSYIYFNKVVISQVLIDLVFLIFFTWLLNYLCIKDYKSISWFLFIFFIIISFSLIFFIKKFNLTYNDLQNENALESKIRLY
jgi:hypothetical protein